MSQIAPERVEIRTSQAPGPYHGARYSQGLRVGDLVFVSGMIGLDPSEGIIKGKTLTEQLRQVFSNIEAVLEAGGTDARKIVKVIVYLADMADYEEMNSLYANFVIGDPPPVRTTVQAVLPAGARIEIDVIAVT
jgi:2-iminobutanoate/2-iminopropanoate deaminase